MATNRAVQIDEKHVITCNASLNDLFHVCTLHPVHVVAYASVSGQKRTADADVQSRRRLVLQEIADDGVHASGAQIRVYRSSAKSASTVQIHVVQRRQQRKHLQ